MQPVAEELEKYLVNNYKNALLLRANTSDFLTFKQIFLYNEYDIEIEFEPEFIIDGGAYVGYSSVYFGNRFPNAKIVALEPAKSNYDLLVKNTVSYNNIYNYNAGLWSTKTSLTVKDEGYGNWGFFVKEIAYENRIDENYIKGIPISEILNSSGFNTIDILKLDIEGSELEIFSKNYEPWLGKVRMIIIELHDRLRTGCSDAFYNATRNYNFSYSRSGENIVLKNLEIVSSS